MTTENSDAVHDLEGAENSAGQLAHVVTCSTRAAAGHYPDRGGPILVDWLRERGFSTPDSTVVADGPAVGEAIAAALSHGNDLVITSGGTGLSPTDSTPEQTKPLLSYEVRGLTEEIRRRGTAATPQAMLSRALSGVADSPGSCSGRALVINLPGSPGAVRDSIEALDPVLDHALAQLAGGDHSNSDQSNRHSRHQAGLSHPDDPDLGSVTERVRAAQISATPISAGWACERVRDDRCGAVVSFSGVVRNHDEGRKVDFLRYVGHPEAEVVMTQIVAGVAERHPDAMLSAAHRVGDLRVGDVALVCAASAAHRRAALDAVDALVEQVKLHLPIWKEQSFSDGTSEWVGALE